MNKMESNKERNLSITNVIKQSSNIFLCECMADCRKTTTILDMFYKTYKYTVFELCY